MNVFLKRIAKRSLILFADFKCYCTVTMDAIEIAKCAAAKLAVDRHIENGQIVGIGSGSTIVYAVERIVEKVKNEGLIISCIPSSFQAKNLIQQNDLNLTDLDRNSVIDITLDGADEVDQSLNCIKGGGACLTQEKIIASCSKDFVVIADSRKDSYNLGDHWHKGIPVEVIPMAYRPIQTRLNAELGLTAQLRMAKQKAGPVVTDNGNFILDCKFSSEILDWKSLNISIKMIPGVVETGMFIGMATCAYFGHPDGNVTTRSKPN